tara:strand:+ start:254 stop:811 length:558 start_codon:yes stop_codon:yes gene_type:complete
MKFKRKEMMFNMFSNTKIELENYTKKTPVKEDGDSWYYSPSGYRQRVSTHAAKNKNRMFVNGKYIPSSHPLHKPGRYKSLDDAWSHNKIESVNEGEVYAIGNKAWPEWIKIGKAVDAEDRLNGYQTSSPFRDYFIITKVATKNRHDAERKMHRLFEEKAEERSNEWFKISQSKLMELFDGFRAAS